MSLKANGSCSIVKGIIQEMQPADLLYVGNWISNEQIDESKLLERTPTQ